MSTILNCPRPGSLGDNVSIPPPPSCSPLSGKSSSNTKTDSFDGGNGVGCANILTAGKVPVAVHVTAGATGTQAIGAPPMPWPEDAFAVSNGLAASPGRTEI